MVPAPQSRILSFAWSLLLLLVPVRAWAVTIELLAGPIDNGQITVAAVLRADGANVGGMQNDLVFDRRAINLPSASRCRIHPAIGTARDNCDEDPAHITEPCKTLTRHVGSCGVSPSIPGCEGESATMSRFRAIVVATAVPNNNAIPDGSVLYTCDFDVVDAGRLPVTIRNGNVVVSSPFGVRLDAIGLPATAPGSAVPSSPVPTRTIRPAGAATATRTPTRMATPPITQGVRVHVGTGVIDEWGHAVVEVTLLGDGVGGVQNDILFDTNAIDLASATRCTINPAIGTTQENCDEDVADIVEPCKTLSRNLVSCGAAPFAPGCDGQPANISRFRAIIAATAVPNNVAIPSGSILYRCVFDVVDRRLLPATLSNRHIVAADPFGQYLAVDGQTGAVVDDPAIPTLPPRPPTATRIPTATHTPLPVPAGGRCSSTGDCQPGLFCNERDGFICCNELECPANRTCRNPSNPGFCTLLPTPTPTRWVNGGRCSENSPEVCSSGNCVHQTCCELPFCVNDDRCDITGFAGRCVPPLPEGALCGKNFDCLGSLQCLNLDGTGARCTLRPVTPTAMPTLAPTATPVASVSVRTVLPTPVSSVRNELQSSCLLVGGYESAHLQFVNDRVVRNLSFLGCDVFSCGVFDIMLSSNGALAFVGVADRSDRIVVVDVSRAEAIGEITFGEDTFVAGMVPSPDGRRLYVALHETGEVAIVDVASRTATTRIRVGSLAGSLALSRDGARLYVGIDSEARIAVVAPNERRVVGGFEIPNASPVSGHAWEEYFDLALTPNGRQLLITLVGYGETSGAWLLNATTGAPVHSWESGGTYAGMRISPDGQRAYHGGGIPWDEEGLLSTISLTTGRTLLELPLGGFPLELGLSRDGALLFALQECWGCDSAAIEIVDTRSNVSRGFVSVGPSRSALAVAPFPCLGRPSSDAPHGEGVGSSGGSGCAVEPVDSSMSNTAWPLALAMVLGWRMRRRRRSCRTGQTVPPSVMMNAT